MSSPQNFHQPFWRRLAGEASIFAPQGQQSRLSHYAALAAIGGLYLIPLIWLIGYFWPPLNHDAAVVLNVSKRWLEGEWIYVEAIDVNPPLIFVLSLLPEALAKILPFSSPTILVGCLVIWITASFWICLRLVHFTVNGHKPLGRVVIPACMLFLMSMLPNDMFAQREHILLIATFPYLLLAAARGDGLTLPSRPLRLATAALAFLGFALKPFFFAAFALIELYLLWRRGWRATFSDLVPWTIGLMTLGYLAFIFLVTPDYVTFVIPLAQGFYTRLGEEQFHALLYGKLILPTIATLIPLALVVFTVMRATLARVTALYAIGMVISAVAQGKGWEYQSLPAIAATLLLLAIAASRLMDRYLSESRAQQSLPIAALASILMLSFYYQISLFNQPFKKQLEWPDSIADRMVQELRQIRKDDRVLILSPGIYPHFPALNYLGMSIIMRFESLWLLQGIYASCGELEPLYNPPEAMSEAEAFVFRTVPQDFADKKPSVLILDIVPGMPRCRAQAFSYLDYFMRNPLFAETFENYQLVTEFDRYRIYQRKD